MSPGPEEPTTEAGEPAAHPSATDAPDPQPLDAESPAGRPAATHVTRAFQDALEQLMAAMPADAARVVMLAAVPRRLDRALLADLLGDGGDVEGALKLLRPLRFVHWTADGRFRLHDEARSHLRQRLQRTEPAAWTAANAAALSSFQTRARAARDPAAPADRVEALVHWFAVDEPAALVALGHRFDEALWNHQLGLAEQYVRAATEQADLLSPRALEWVRFYEARLRRAYRRADGGEAVFATLARDASDPALAAAASLQLGRSLMDRQRWHEGLQRFHDAARAVEGPGGRARREADPDRRTARSAADAASAAAQLAADIRLARGDAYRDLAFRSGGFPPHGAARRGVWHSLRWLPFLAVRGMARRWRRAPNWWWWQAETGYQDWLIAWLLQRAARWYRGARDEGPAGARRQADVHLALAETSRQLGRWADARQRYGAALEQDVVRASPYGLARVQMGLGSVALAAGEVDEAHEQVAEALVAFRRFGDSAGMGAATVALGRAAMADGRPAEAVQAYVESVRALGAARDGLSQTEVAVELETLAALRDLPEVSRSAALGAAGEVLQRHYLARFPGSLLTLFRNVALYAALPITFVVGSLLATVVVILVGWVVESEWLLLTLGHADALSVGDHLTLLAFAVALALIAVWTFPFVYGFLGMLLVRSIGRDLIAIEREQPAVASTDPLAIRLFDTEHPDGRVLPWSDASGAEAVDLRLWRAPVALLSRTAVRRGREAPLVIEAITAGYEALQADIAARLVAPARLRRWDLRLLAPSWVAGVLGVAVVLVGVARALGAVPTLTTEVIRPGTGAGLELTLALTPALAMVVPTFVLLYTTLTHWRLVRHGRRVTQATGLRLDVIPAPLLLAAAVAWTVLSALWLAWLLWPGSSP